MNRLGRMSTQIVTRPVKNYITPGGLQRLRDELRFLLTRERPAVTEVVAWAAGNGDRVKLQAPAGSVDLQILDVRYQRIPVQPFVEPPGAESASNVSVGGGCDHDPPRPKRDVTHVDTLPARPPDTLGRRSDDS